MIVKLIAALVVMGVCGVSASGLMAQQPAPKTLRIIEYQGDFTTLLGAMTNAYGVTVGLELDTKGHHFVRVSLQDATITDVMNAMVQSVPTFQWVQTGEFIDVWPSAKSNPLLETRISSFDVKNLSPSEAFDRLFDLPEVQANMTELKLKRRAPDSPRAKLRSSRFSIKLEGVTLREALHRIAQESGIEIWVFRNYFHGFFSISSV